MNSEYVVRLDDCEASWTDQVGVTASRLHRLAGRGSCPPEGFVVTAAAYREFVHENRLGPVIAQAIRRVRAGRDVRAAAAGIRTAFRDAPMPPAVAAAILAAYGDLGGEGTEVTVTCSPPSNRPDGGETFHQLRTGTDVLAACRRCFAAAFTAVAFSNREATGESHLTTTMPVLVRPTSPTRPTTGHHRARAVPELV
jgi:phosphoenolpyruvate synthase/pyruvate phosphate dikinase